jgi:hypothetical protein
MFLIPSQKNPCGLPGGTLRCPKEALETKTRHVIQPGINGAKFDARRRSAFDVCEGAGPVERRRKISRKEQQKTARPS